MGKFCTRAELAAWEMALEAFPERSPLSLRERLMELFPADFTFPDEKKAFANMASAAIVNPESFTLMKKCLPKSYEIFVEILKRMTLGI